MTVLLTPNIWDVICQLMIAGWAVDMIILYQKLNLNPTAPALTRAVWSLSACVPVQPFLAVKLALPDLLRQPEHPDNHCCCAEHEHNRYPCAVTKSENTHCINASSKCACHHQANL
jgi:hypothetical protein